MKAKELKELTTEELAAKLDGAKAELFSLRFQLATNQLENPMRIRDARHSIARIMTLMRERELKVSKA